MPCSIDLVRKAFAESSSRDAGLQDRLILQAAHGVG
jgi:hypothetical protein